MENIIIGCQVMIIGMGVVYVFLSIMIFIMHLSAKAITIINRYFPEPIVETTSKKKKKPLIEDEIAIAIALAFQKENEKC